MQTTHNYTAVFNKDTPQQGLTLTKDGSNTICINRQPIVSQTQMGALNIQQLNCCTSCPFANVTKNDAGEFIYQVSCGKQLKEFTVTNKEQLEKHFASAEEKPTETTKPGLIVV